MTLPEGPHREEEVTCFGCGRPVRVYSGGEGTNSYEPIGDDERIATLQAKIESLTKAYGYPCCTIHGQPACLDCAADCSNAEAKLTEATKLIDRLVDQLKVNNESVRENIALWNVHLIREASDFLKGGK